MCRHDLGSAFELHASLSFNDKGKVKRLNENKNKQTKKPKYLCSLSDTNQCPKIIFCSRKFLNIKKWTLRTKRQRNEGFVKTQTQLSEQRSSSSTSLGKINHDAEGKRGLRNIFKRRFSLFCSCHPSHTHAHSLTWNWLQKDADDPCFTYELLEECRH